METLILQLDLFECNINYCERKENSLLECQINIAFIVKIKFVFRFNIA